jgi:hypothetical protein
MRKLAIIPLVLALLGCGDNGGGSPLRVDESERLGTTWDCSDSAICIDDYLAFPERAVEYSRPLSEEDLNSWIDDCRYGRVTVHTETLKPETLREGLLGALNIRFLLEGLDKRPLEVAIIRREDHGDYTEEEILFTDPFVGTFQGILLLPPGPGPHRGIVAVHGHSDSAAVFRDDYHGTAYPPEGFAILMLTMRAMGFDEKETEATWALLSNGFNLIGLRIYESLLGFKYLRWRKDIDEFRLGLIGHSGGSSTGNLTIRLEPRLRAYVSDHMVAYMTSDMDIIHCETVPAVYPYNRLINYFDTAEVPVLSVTYGYPNGPGELIEFFKQKIR